MGDILGGGGGGGGGGDETDTKEKSIPSPAAIAAMRAAANAASGQAGMAKNLPYFAQIASSPSYRTSLQDTANTWNDWMGQGDLNLMEGMAPITEGRFGSVIDAGQGMTDAIAGIEDPVIRYMISQWAGPGRIDANSPYAPIKYNPYISQAKLMSKESDPTGAGGSGTIGAGGIPTSTTPGAVLDPPGPSGPGPSGPGPTGPGPTGPVTAPGGGPPPPGQRVPGMRGRLPNGGTWKIDAKGRLITYAPARQQGGQGGGMGQQSPTGQGVGGGPGGGGFQGGWGNSAQIASYGPRGPTSI